MIIDTHCHLDFPEFDRDRGEVIERAKMSNVGYMINVASSFEGSRRSVELAEKYDNIFASLGAHPHHAEDIKEEGLSEIMRLSENKKVVAIGEVGLDYFRERSDPLEQREAFLKFINIAKEKNMPLIVHDRDAHDDCLSLLKEALPRGGRVVLHCFSGDRNVLKKVLDMGFYVSFTGNLTFPNAKELRETIKFVPLERMFLETDAPFLAPQSKRGKRNEPAYLPELRNKIAETLGISAEEVEKVTTKEAIKFFGLPIKQ